MAHPSIPDEGASLSRFREVQETETARLSTVSNGNIALPIARSGAARPLSEEQVAILRSSLRSASQQASTEILASMMKTAKKTQNALPPSPHQDSAFVPDAETYAKLQPRLAHLLENTKEFDVGIFLRGPKAQGVKENDQLLERAVLELSALAKEVAKEKNIPLIGAYKLVLGAIDALDEKNSEGAQHNFLLRSGVPKEIANETGISLFEAYERIYGSSDPSKENSLGKAAPSTFALRSALLLASQADGATLDSWMVYTKKGKLDEANIWTFLDEPKNWIPEAQAQMAKATEALIVKAQALAIQQPDNVVLLFKGGFGAGKTTLAKTLLQENSSAVVSPDRAKGVVLQSMPTVSHAAAHFQGSQVAYKLFDELIEKVAGTCGYDSSLSRAGDLKGYLVKCEKSHKKMVVYEVAQNDMARALSVLKRPINGEDPRIPAEFFILGTIRDHLNRVECMKVVLDSKIKGEAVRPEYHFISADGRGANREEVMVLRSEQDIQFTARAKERLALVGIELQADEKSLKLNVNEAGLKKQFAEQFLRPVKEILAGLAENEQVELQQCFKGRIFQIDQPSRAVVDAGDLYSRLPANVRKALPQARFVEALGSLPDSERTKFFASIQNKSSFSYLDLPLKAAWTIHETLLFDPWT